jgi:hypothetical protein
MAKSPLAANNSPRMNKSVEIPGMEKGRSLRAATDLGNPFYPAVWRGRSNRIFHRTLGRCQKRRARLSLDFARDPDPFDSAQGHPELVERMSLSNGLPSRYPRSPVRLGGSLALHTLCKLEPALSRGLDSRSAASRGTSLRYDFAE